MSKIDRKEKCKNSQSARLTYGKLDIDKTLKWENIVTKLNVKIEKIKKFV